MSNLTPKRRGRPPGPPKEPKPAAKMGRPSVWTGGTINQGITAPPQFFELFKLPEFKRRIQELMVEFKV